MGLSRRLASTKKLSDPWSALGTPLVDDGVRRGDALPLLVSCRAESTGPVEVEHSFRGQMRDDERFVVT